MRFYTGLGIGGVLANINIVVAEYASNRRRNLSISLMSLGYPIGATLGGAFSVYLISAFGWRSVYVFGGLVALILVPAVIRFMPESLDYLIARRPAGALDKVNRVLARIGRPPCPPSPPRKGRKKRPTPACSPSSGLPMPGGRWRCASRISA